ncbi:transposase [Clostridium sp. 'deep sea']|uniref:transposase n=1 Tax=Clostridium sp. 'deep sea' TaxID=2779445 RepID=UPI00189681D5|nr:transposase [Clostridium sp. 'deep sea']QOR35992.1 transposase [Clostridium sp. 'deep sea']
MPRCARKVSSTDFYHLMIRGINKEAVFNTDQHKYVLLKYINEQVELNYIGLLAWCIMGNHAHLVVKAELSNISRFIKIVLLKYAKYYNNANDRVGPVFGDRFRSEVIQDDNSLKQVVRYVHRNPTKACLVEKIEEYKFSSYFEFIYKEKYISKSLKEFYMDYFRNNKKRYINFHQEEEIADYFIDTKEQIAKNIQELFWQTLNDFNREHNVDILNEYKTNKCLFNELIYILYEQTGYSYSKIAKLLGMSVAKVRYALKKYSETIF